MTMTIMMVDSLKDDNYGDHGGEDGDYDAHDGHDGDVYHDDYDYV